MVQRQHFSRHCFGRTVLMLPNGMLAASATPSEETPPETIVHARMARRHPNTRQVKIAYDVARAGMIASAVGGPLADLAARIQSDQTRLASAVRVDAAGADGRQQSCISTDYPLGQPSAS